MTIRHAAPPARRVGAARALALVLAGALAGCDAPEPAAGASAEEERQLDEAAAALDANSPSAELFETVGNPDEGNSR